MRRYLQYFECNIFHFSRQYNLLIQITLISSCFTWDYYSQGHAYWLPLRLLPLYLELNFISQYTNLSSYLQVPRFPRTQHENTTVCLMSIHSTVEHLVEGLNIFSVFSCHSSFLYSYNFSTPHYSREETSKHYIENSSKRLLKCYLY